jgi:hypothetical protein
MADLVDVEIALVGCVSGGIYPQGTNASSVLGIDCKIYRGWPIPAALNADLAAGDVNISISPDASQGRTTTRYIPKWVMTVPAATLTATVTGRTVTLTGAVTTGVAVGICIDHAKTYVYRPQAQDNTAMIAANLAAQITPDCMALVAGSTISLPEATFVQARVVPDGVGTQEIRRQEREVRVIAWCPTPLLRDQVTAAIDASLANQSFITLGDGTSARLEYHGTQVFDQSQNALLYRRDLIYKAEYASVATISGPGMLFGSLLMDADSLTV